MEKKINLEKGFYLLVKEININFDTNEKSVNYELLKFSDSVSLEEKIRFYQNRNDGETLYILDDFIIN